MSSPLFSSVAYVANADSRDISLLQLAASYGGHKISVSAIGADGVVAGPAVAVLPTGKNAHAAIIDATNRNLFVTNLGSDQVLQYKFDAATGKLAPNDPPVLATRPLQAPGCWPWARRPTP